MSRFTQNLTRNETRASHRILTVLAVAVALSLAAPVFAADATPAPADKTTAQPQAGSHIIRHDPKITDLGTVNVTPGGAMRDGANAWDDDDTSAPALPMVRAKDADAR